MKRSWMIIREALASARSQPVASVVTVIMVAGMCATVLMTTGRTVGAEQAVLGSIDSAGTRSIVVRADSDAGLDTSVLDRLAKLDGIEWAGAFGAAQDAQNAAFPGGTPVPVRLAWGNDFKALGIRDLPLAGRSAVASATALEQLGMQDEAGGILSGDGNQYAVVGSIEVPDYLSFLEPLVIVPQTEAAGRASSPVSILVVIAARPDLVAPVSKAVRSVLAVDDVTKVKFSTSEGLAQLRALVQGQLGGFGRNLVFVIFALTAILVAAILYGLVMLRRKDFGRRRALGASQSLIVTLLLIQMMLLSAVGAIVGSVGAAIGLAVTGDPLPGFDFFAAVGTLAIVTGLAAALVPAVVAARRDPLKELRVP